MEIMCKCGNDCIKNASMILENIESFYRPCPQCVDPKFKKFKPLSQQIDLEKINSNFGKCNCGKRHMDTVMAHLLKIMMDEGIKSPESTLRQAATPLITPGYPTPYVPFLPEKSLIIITDEMEKNCADRIIKEIKEIKGVIKGDTKKPVGLKDSSYDPYVYELLAGCDLRCDILPSPYGDICIYKKQTDIHIEFSQTRSPKIEKILRILTKYKLPKILDSTCGPGTLGIVCLKSGAKKVVFNDIWPPAVDMTLINLEINGFSVDKLKNNSTLKKNHNNTSPIASGDNFEVFCTDIRNLKNVLEERFDIGIIDTFPGVEEKEFIDSLDNLCHEILII
ncbi:MAG: 50S ribosomal protein L11 methyltransferase [Methanomicrobiales archaeon]